MVLNPIKANLNAVYFNDGLQVLFSYHTPVAATINGEYFRTGKRWSNTTTRHINAWLGGVKALERPQEFFDSLVAGVK